MKDYLGEIGKWNLQKPDTKFMMLKTFSRVRFLGKEKKKKE